ncbi:hypothetical protein JCM8208_000642 [Rhodotorula glutinis]
MLLSLPLLACAAFRLALAFPQPAKLSKDIEHDPSLVKTPNGTYILVGTGKAIPTFTSIDRLTWTNIGDAFLEGAPKDALALAGNKDVWALDISFVDGTYILYYSTSTFGTQKSAIWLATSPTGLPGSWTNKGKVLESKEGDPYNAIDAHLFISSTGSRHLVWGSYWSGIFLGNVDVKTGLLTSDKYVNLAARPGAGVIEAPWLYERDGVFYLFTSWDQCCQGTKSTYHMRVATSRSLEGPFLDSDGKPALEGHMTLLMDSHDDVYGPGGQLLLEDDDGVVLVYHRYFGTGSTGLLSLNMLDF